MIAASKPEIATDIEALSNFLAGLSSGATAEYSAMSAVLGRDVLGRGRYVLDRAVALAEEKTGALFENVRMVGIKRLAPTEATQVGKAVIAKIRRTASRGSERLDGFRENLPPSEQIKLIAYRSQLGAVALVAENSGATKIATLGQSNTVPAGRVLELFR